MRLIDADKLRTEYLGMPNCYNGFSDSYDKAMIVDMVDEQPTIDAVPVVHAHLINPDPYGECSNCGYLIDIRQEYNYCPNCGAKMDGERKDSTNA